MGTGRPVLEAWVVFSGASSLRFQRFLRPGFRHCFVILFDGVNWISVDPLLGRIEIMVHQIPDHVDFPGWLASQGLVVIKSRNILIQKKIAPVMFCTCVEIVKRVLGIHRLCIVTPYQLYRYLQKQAEG